ncbi:hypothetical protein I4U23_023988 [Adineta vaga]|nr:hypothetical protein I4U23_023988 [Adineta vaga]
MQNVLVIWLDSSIDGNSEDCHNTLTQLQSVASSIDTFIDADLCIEFIQGITNDKICLITSGSLGQYIVSRIHSMPQMDSIFIFCSNKKSHEQWAKEWPKIKGVFTDIASICTALKEAAQRCEHNAMPLSFVPADKKSDQLDPYFIFLSTSKIQQVSLHFAQNAAVNPDLVGVVFIMKIDPIQSPIPYASIRDVSYYENEDEVLFPMHTVFKIHNLKLTNNTNRLYEVNLTLSNDNDQELYALTNYIRKQFPLHVDGWYRLDSRKKLERVRLKLDVTNII